MRVLWVKKLLIIAAWLAIWQLAAFVIDNPHLLCGPINVVYALCGLITRETFWLSVGWSILRIGIGFVAGTFFGCTFGATSARFLIVQRFLEPLVHVIKSAPVVCIIALLLVMFGSGATTSIVVAMVVFPPTYFAVISAHTSRSEALEELARAFHMTQLRKFFYIELPQYEPFLYAALKTTVGMSWKAGVAAEIIGLPGMSIGEAVYLSKLTLDIPAIIGWTSVVILLGWICEKLVLWCVKRIILAPKLRLDRKIANIPPQNEFTYKDCENLSNAKKANGISLEISEITKTYGTTNVLDNFSIHIDAGERICIMAPSGTGKTTLLRIISGMELADKGTVSLNGNISTVSQAPRLIETFTAPENIAAVAKNASEIARGIDLLKALIPEYKSWSEKPVEDLSGGMRRRVELARALAHESSAVILDEPFAGLDEESRANAARITSDWLCGRTLVVATHDVHDAYLLDAKIIRLD